MVKILFIKKCERSTLRDIGEADIVFENDGEHFVFVKKNKLNGIVGSVHNTIFMDMLKGEFSDVS